MKQILFSLGLMICIQFGLSQELILYYQVNTFLTYDEVHLYAFNKSGRNLNLAELEIAVLYDSLQNRQPTIVSDLIEADFASQSRLQRELKAQPYEYLDESVSPPVVRNTYRINEATLNYMAIYKSQMDQVSGSSFPLPNNGALLDVMTIRFEKQTSGLEPDFFLASGDVFEGSKLMSNEGEILEFEVSLITSVTYPVEWLSFEGRQTGPEKVQLSWATGREESNAGFQIERSMNGQIFEPIGFINGMGTQSGTQEYYFVDPDARDRVYYYRIRQQDFNGSYSYSTTEMVRLGETKNIELNIFPNPAVQDLHVKLYLSEGAKFAYSIMDTKGALISQGISSQKEFTLDISTYKSGFYRIAFEEVGSGGLQTVSKGFIVR